MLKIMSVRIFRNPGKVLKELLQVLGRIPRKVLESVFGKFWNIILRGILHNIILALMPRGIM